MKILSLCLITMLLTIPCFASNHEQNNNQQEKIIVINENALFNSIETILNDLIVFLKNVEWNNIFTALYDFFGNIFYACIQLFKDIEDTKHHKEKKAFYNYEGHDYA